MSEPFIAEVRIFAGNFAPRNWSFCDGQLLPIAQNTALFSLIGTIYGGDGRTTTALPNLKGRAPMHPGRGPGLTTRTLGQTLGSDAITLTSGHVPSHDHDLSATNSPGSSFSPGPTMTPARSVGAAAYADTADSDGVSLDNTGSGASHNNLQPFLTMSFIIALVGTYPSRS